MRTQIAMMFVVAVFSASVVAAQDIADESKAVKKIEVLGGKIDRDDALPDRPVVGVSFKKNCRFNEKYLHLLKAVQGLNSLDIVEATITDAGLKEIGELTNLTSLQLGGSEITDKGIAELHNLKNLTELALCSTGVTPNGLIELRQSLPNLRIFDDSTALDRIRQVGAVIDMGGKPEAPAIVEIFFDNTASRINTTQAVVGLFNAGDHSEKLPMVTDADLKELKGLQGATTLTTVRFERCSELTDAGIEELVQLKHLKVIQIVDCKQLTGA